MSYQIRRESIHHSGSRRECRIPYNSLTTEGTEAKLLKFWWHDELVLSSFYKFTILTCHECLRGQGSFVSTHLLDGRISPT